MATPFSALIDNSGNSYTVPSGEFIIFSAFPNASTNARLRVGGVNRAYLDLDGAGRGPFVATSGQVLTSDVAMGIAGFRFPNSAASAFNALLNNDNINPASTYTVPAGKHAVFSCFPATNSNIVFTVGGVPRGFIELDGGGHGPFVATSGQVVAVSTVSAAGIFGFLYDN